VYGHRAAQSPREIERVDNRESTISGVRRKEHRRRINATADHCGSDARFIEDSKSRCVT
jgi:hypothetical protein